MPDLCDFSDCELETLRLLAVGYTQKEAAQVMCVSLSATKTRLAQTMDKLHARTTTATVARAIWLGLITLE